MGNVHEIVAPLIKGLGFVIVELTDKQRNKTLHVNLVIYDPQGIDIDDCAAVYKAVFPRLEVATEARDVHLEVSSPGVYRKLKDASEFEVFTGLRAKLMPNDEPEWVVGTITETSSESVSLEHDGATRSFRFAEIRKAQLVYP